MTHPGQLLKQAGLFAGKERGQNFLSNSGTAEMIVEKTRITHADQVLEIGPGLGALTIHIARRTQKITAIEKDSRLVPILKKELAVHDIHHVKILNTDVLKFDFTALPADKKIVVIGNLPYNLSSRILFKLVEARNCIERAFLMFQKELAQRICASPGGRDFSRLSAVVRYAAEIEKVTDIGPACFFPKPDIDSTVLKFKFFQTAAFDHEQEKMLFSIIKAAFSKRRKALKNAMCGGEFNFKKSQVAKALKTAGIEAERRAETLTTEEFKSLTCALMEES